jgi:hypothetical protein
MLHEAFTREMSGMTAIPYNSSSTYFPALVRELKHLICQSTAGQIAIKM